MDDNNRNENRDGGSGWQGQEYGRQPSETEQNGNDQQNGPYGQYHTYEQGGAYQQYGQYQKADPGKPGNGFGIAAMILGIVSLALFCTCINIPLAIAAAVLAVIQMTRSREGRGFAIAGIVTGALSVILFVIMMALMIPYLSYYREELLDLPRSGYENNYGGDDPDDFGDYFDFFDNDEYQIPQPDSGGQPDDL